jgi:multisubunit Na+/H+ antiporter MnhB subunit
MLAPLAMSNLPATQVGNPITGVLLAFRALDTLLEAIVLVIGLIGVWTLAPDRVWDGRPGPRSAADPDGVPAYLARLLPPIGIVVGIYLVWAGADHPGGKFQSATILAALWMLVQMAGLADAPRIGRRWLRGGVVVGPLVFVAIGLLGA